MSFDFEECETKFETSRKQLECRITSIQRSNEHLVTLMSLKQEQLIEIKEEMKQELSSIKQIINQMEQEGKRDQKFQLKSLKQKLLKCEDQHKIILRQLLKSSITQQFDRLSLKDSNAISSYSQQERYFVDQSSKSSKTNSIPNSLPTQNAIPITSPSKQQSQLSFSLKKPLIDKEDQVLQRESNDKESEEIEQLAVKQLNEEQIEYQKLQAEQESLEKYNKEIDQLVTFDENGKKCFKYSIIGAIVLILLGAAAFLIIHYLYK